MPPGLDALTRGVARADIHVDGVDQPHGAAERDANVDVRLACSAMCQCGLRTVDQHLGWVREFRSVEVIISRVKRKA